MGHPTSVIRSLEVSSDGSLALRGKTYTVVLALVANTEATLTVPTYATASGGTAQASRCLFAGNGDYWVNYDLSLAAVPSANSIDGTAPEFKPNMRIITDVTVLHLIAPFNTLVSIMFFQA